MTRIKLEHGCVGLLALSLLALPACYSGLSVSPALDSESTGPEVGEDAADDTAGEGEGTGGDDGSDDGPDGEPVACDGVSPGSVPLRRLSRSAYQNTIRDLLGVDVDVDGFPGDQHVVGFINNVSVPITLVAVEDYQAAAESLASQATADVDAFTGCDRATTEAPECAEAFIREFGRRAWRRPLTDDEVSEVMALYDAGDGYADRIRLVVQGLLQSPHFLYLVEIGTPSTEGDGIAELTSYELASRLSYLLWDSMPDDELLGAADADALRDVDELRRQAERMLEDDKAAASISRFHRQWVTMEDHDLDTVVKDDERYPDFDSLRPSMAQEIELLADYVVREGDGQFETLMTAPYSFMDPELAAFYGRDLGADAAELPPWPALPPGVAAVTLDPQGGHGLLTRAGVLAALANPTATNIPARGRFILERLQCHEIPDPPPDVEGDPPVPEPGATAREQLETKTSVPPCAGCHDLLNPVGALFEQYGPMGEFREFDEQGNPLDASGSIPVGQLEGDYDSVHEMVHLLPDSAQVRACYARQWFRYSYGSDVVSDSDACNHHRLVARFEETDGDIRSLLLALVTSDGFRLRNAD